MVRLIYGLKSRDHVTPAFRELPVEQLESSTNYSCFLMHLIHTKRSTSYLFDTFADIASIPLRSRLRSASSQCYELPSFRLNMVNGVSHSPALQLGIRYRLLDLLNQTDTNFSFIVLLTIDFTSSFVNALLVT